MVLCLKKKKSSIAARATTVDVESNVVYDDGDANGVAGGGHVEDPM